MANSNNTSDKKGVAPRRQSLSDLAYEEIKWRIITDELRAGMLFTENDICEITGFGKAPIRAALMELKHDKLIDVLPRKGFFVRPWSAEEAAQLLFIRRLIEPELAARAARIADDRTRKDLQRIVASAGGYAKANNRRALLESDNELHLAIARASGIEVGAEVIGMLKLRSHYLWHVSISSQAQLEAVQSQHEGILAAILNRDSEAARTAMREHLTRLDAVQEIL